MRRATRLFFFNDTATTEIYTLSLHDALPISRAIARHWGKHIPGNPAIIVENMTGAGSLIAANHVYVVAKPDGVTIGHFIGGLFLGQVLGQKGIEFDARKFEYIGAPVKDHVVCAFTKASGITSLERWTNSKTPVKMGGIAP